MAKEKTHRKEVVSFRLEPRIKYLVDIAARVQRRSPTNYIEYALEESLKNVKINDDESVYDNQYYLWFDSEAHRVIHLAEYFPHLLTFEEERIIELIKKYSAHTLNEIEVSKLLNKKDIIEESARDWSILSSAAKGDQEAIDWLDKKYSFKHNIIATIRELPNPSIEELKNIIERYITKSSGKTLEDLVMIETVQDNMEKFLIDPLGKIEIENIDFEKLQKQWKLLQLASYLPSASIIISLNPELLDLINHDGK